MTTKMTSKKILVIDDEDDIREVAKISLELMAGFNVILAETGQEGIKKAEYEQPDAILLDVMLPDMNGIDTLAKLQDNPLTKNIPVIFLTAKTQITDQHRFAKLNIKAMITKPFKPATLVQDLMTSLGWKY